MLNREKKYSVTKENKKKLTKMLASLANFQLLYETPNWVLRPIAFSSWRSGEGDCGSLALEQVGMPFGLKFCLVTPM